MATFSCKLRFSFRCLLLLGGLLLSACAASVATEAAETVEHRFLLYTLQKNSVAVTVELRQTAAGASEFMATFTPDDPTLHLYGKDLPRHGIQGAGRPTLLEIVGESALVPGALQADVQPSLHHFHGFAESFPLYPDGPVTLILPVSLARQPADSQLELSLTYMACSSSGACKPPVIDHRFAVTLPPEAWSSE